MALYHRLRDLFSLKPDLVLYDITRTSFEGAGPRDFAKHGSSRDGKPRNVQVIVGVVMVAGWPITHHVCRADSKVRCLSLGPGVQERAGLRATAITDVPNGIGKRWSRRSSHTQTRRMAVLTAGTGIPCWATFRSRPALSSRAINLGRNKVRNR